MMFTVQSAYRVNRTKLLMSCATMAIATAALLPAKANAQAFNGTATSSTNVQTSSLTTDTIVVTGNNASINWTASSNDFLPEAATQNFTSTTGITDYTVLNRITPADTSTPIQLNGTLISTIQGSSTTGGNIWFYSPSGIVVGAHAVFDVGGLLLTSLDIGNDFSADANGFHSSFAAGQNGAGKVQIMSGANISANNYVALIAPRIEQAGSVTSGGSVAYVAGEQLSMTFSQGLFDVSVNVGTDDPNGIDHSGSTIGIDNGSGRQGIYMVAVPKNNALQMLLSGGTVGFQDANGVSVKDGQIILSAGYGIGHDTDGDVVFLGEELGGAIGGPRASLDISGGDYLSSVNAHATGYASASGGEGGNLDIAGDLTLQGLLGASVIANPGQTITIGGNARISADDLRYFDNSSSDYGMNATGGTAQVIAYSGGTISIGNDLFLSADAAGDSNMGEGGIGGTGDGGIVHLTTYGDGEISVGRDAFVSANGWGGDGAAQGGDGNGGYAYLSMDGGSITVGGNLRLTADGIGGAGMDAGDGYGGYAEADIGAVEGSTLGGLMNITGEFRVQAAGEGGAGLDNPTGTGGTGGDGYGGYASFYTSDWLSEGASITVNADMIYVTANSQGGDGGDGLIGGDGGTAYWWGSAYADLYGGSIHAHEIQAFSTARGGFGGNGSDGAGGRGGDAFGGDSEVIVGGTFSGGASSYDRGIGGDGGQGTTVDGDGGDAEGGYAYIEVLAGGTLNGSVDVNTTALGGAGGNGGYGYGGDSELYVEGTLAAPFVNIDSSAIGGNGSSGNGGDASGGDSYMEIYGGNVTVDGTMRIAANGTMDLDGDGNFDAASGAVNGGNSSGGYAELYVYGGSLEAGDTNVAAHALGGAGGALGDGSGTGGRGGDAAGGVTDIEIYGDEGGNTVVTLGDLFINSSGLGGAGGSAATGGSGGNGYGGFNELYIEGGTVTAGEVTSVARGVGGVGGAGSAGLGGNGGEGLAGYWYDGCGETCGEVTAASSGPSSYLYVGDGSSFDVTSFTTYANGAGGNGGTGSLGSGNGGNGSGGTNLAYIYGDVTSDQGFVITAFSQGGSGAIGGDAAGGYSSIEVEGSLTAAGIVQATGQALGGAGTVTGGDAQGGYGGLYGNGSITSKTLFVSGYAEGGAGGETGGNAIGGEAEVYIGATGSLNVADSSQVRASGVGGDGDTMGSAQGGYVGIHGDAGATIKLGSAEVLATGEGGYVYLGQSECGCGATIGATDLTVDAGGDFSVGNVTVTGTANLTAGGLASFYGVTSAPTITVTSSDINIADGASLGVAGVTNLLTLNAVSDQAIIIGDQPVAPGLAGQYVLSEDGDIYASSVVVNAVSASGGQAPDIQVYDITIEGSGAPGGHVSDVTLNTAGSIVVQGAVDFINAAAGDSLTFNAGDNIEVITDTGSVAMTNSSGGLAGTLTLNADNVWVADSSIIYQLEEDPTSVTAEQLATNNGPFNPNGYVAAGGITANVDSSFLVQNSGSATDLGGITVGAGGLTIVSTAGEVPTGDAAPALAGETWVDIYGREVQPNGSVIGGAAFADAVDTVGEFTEDSQINGVPLNAAPPPPPVDPPPVDPPPVDPPPVDPPPPPPVEPPPVPPPPQVDVGIDQVLGPLGLTEHATTTSAGTDEQQSEDEDKKQDENGDDASVDASLGLINTGAVNLEQQIDEPVTSGSDVEFGTVPDGSH